MNDKLRASIIAGGMLTLLEEQGDDMKGFLSSEQFDKVNQTFDDLQEGYDDDKVSETTKEILMEQIAIMLK